MRFLSSILKILFGKTSPMSLLRWSSLEQLFIADRNSALVAIFLHACIGISEPKAPRTISWWHDVGKFLYYWPFVRGIRLSPVDDARKVPVMRIFGVSLILAWTSCWAIRRLIGYWNGARSVAVWYHIFSSISPTDFVLHITVTQISKPGILQVASLRDEFR